MSKNERKKNITKQSATIYEKRLLVKRSKQLPKLTHDELKLWFFENFKKNINRTTICKWIASGKYDGDDYLATDKSSMRYRTVKYPILDAKLADWCNKYEKIAILTDALIKEQAKIFADELNIPTDLLKLSEGWLVSFKSRYKIKKRTVSGESASVDMAALEVAMPGLLSKISEYDPSDVFNFDESALFYRLRPDKTLSSVQIKGNKKDKERITVAFCTNSTGTEKLQPLVIGKHANPRCFKNNNLTNLNVNYKSNKNAWMTKILFRDWIVSLDQKIKNENRNRKILLLIDNFGGHCIENLDLDNIEIVFLPPGSTSRLQPLDQGIIASFKALYKRKFVRWLLNNYETGMITNKLSLIESIRFISLSWQEVSKETIVNGWNHTGLTNNPIPNSTSNLDDPLEILQKVLSLDLGISNLMTANEYLYVDDLLANEEELQRTITDNIGCSTDSCLPSPITGNPSHELSDESLISFKHVGHKEALDACVILQRYLSQETKDFNKEALILQHLENYIENNMSKNKKQMTLDNFIIKKI